MSDSTRVSVIIPVWNLWEMTAACLRSLAEQSAGENIEVMVVDNHSTDVTTTELEPLGHALFGAAFRALHLTENMGFAKACNAGAQACESDLVFFLNNDTTMTAGWLPPLRTGLATARTGAVGPLLLYPDGTVQHCGVYVSPLGTVGHLYEHFPGSYAACHRPHPLQAITGAALLLRRDTFMDCGGFYEGYRNGFEDLDLCCALRERGLKVRVESASVIFHHTSQTPGRFEHELRNGQILVRRCGRVLRPDLHTLLALDGYSLCIGPDISMWFCLPEAEKQRLNMTLTGKSFQEDRCRQELEREPLWRDGWLALADWLEKKGQWDAALQVMSRCIQFVPERDVLLHWLRLGRRDPDKAAQITRIVEQRNSTPPDAEEHVRSARQRARTLGDADLEKLLSAWLIQYGRKTTSAATDGNTGKQDG